MVGPSTNPANRKKQVGEISIGLRTAFTARRVICSSCDFLLHAIVRFASIKYHVGPLRLSPERGTEENEKGRRKGAKLREKESKNSRDLSILLSDIPP